ncbi:MAG: hypothetical protein ABEJ02_00430 [Candidatus Paceibacteria bacterium]
MTIREGYNPEPSQEEYESESSIERLTRRVDMVRELFSSLGRFSEQGQPSEDLNVDEVEDKLEGVIEKVREKYPQEVVRKSYRISNLREQIEDEESKPGILDKFARDHIERLRSEIQALKQEYDVNFLYSLSQVKEGLMKKYSEARELEGLNNEQQVISELNKLAGTNLRPDDIIDINFDTFSVIVLVSRKKLNEIFGKNPLATNLETTPFILVSSEEEEVLQHEKIHNLLEATKDNFPGRNAANAMERVKFLISLMESGASTEGLDQIKEVISNNFSSSEKILDEQHEELLANMKTAERENFGLDDDSEYIDFDKVFKSLSTAGAELYNEIVLLTDILNMLFSLQSNEDLDKDVEKELESIRKRVEKLRINLRDEIVDYVETMKTAFDLSKELEKGAEELVHSASLLLKPSQASYILKVLEQKFGKDYKEALEKLRSGS